MKICIISEHFFPLIGGTSIYTYEIIKNIADIYKSDEIYLVTLSGNKNQHKLSIKQSNI